MGSETAQPSRAPVPPAALHALYRTAFLEEDLSTLLSGLAALKPATCRTVALLEGGRVLAHAHLTACTAMDASVALLGPLAVAPAARGAGLGRHLIETAIQAARDAAAICVLGDPALYGRFGFAREDAIRPPFALPAEWDGAWQSIRFRDVPEAVLDVPAPWRDPALWS